MQEQLEFSYEIGITQCWCGNNPEPDTTHCEHVRFGRGFCTAKCADAYEEFERQQPQLRLAHYD